jgi:integrase
VILLETSKEALNKFLQYPDIKAWYNGIATQLKESTRGQYTIFLMHYLGKEDPASFLKRAQENSRETTIEIKGRLGEIYKHSMHAAHITKYALRSFMDFHEVGFEVKTKIKVRRVRKKPELSWEDADRIILETDEPYRSILKFMKWSSLGEDEFMEIQTSPSIQRGIEAQRSNDKPYIKIDLSPRKSTLDEFFTLAPKQYMPHFPLKTKVHKNRGGTLIDPHDMQNVWRRAAKKVKLWQVGLGPHTLRSTFATQCGILKVSKAVSEFCMGHGGGDKYGYAREVLNEQYVASELGKLWASQTAASRPLTKYERLKQYASDLGFNPDEIIKEQIEAKVPRRAYKGRTPSDLEKRRTLAAPTEEQLVEMLQTGIRDRLAASLRRTHGSSRTARNGGTPVNAPYETRIVGEEELVPLLNEGWDIVKELSGGRIIVRRSEALDE